MRRIVSQNNNLGSRGVSLVEVMVSLVILLIVFMGLLQASILTIDHNTRNEVRDEAVRITSETMTQARSALFSTLADTAGACTALTAVNRSFRNQLFAFSRCRAVADIDADNKQVTIIVAWTYRGENLTNTFITVMRNQ